MKRTPVFRNGKNLSISLFVLSTLFSPLYSHAAPKWKKIISNSSSGDLQGGFMEINEDTSWTVPAGVTKIRVMVIGGGGGGSGGGAVVLDIVPIVTLASGLTLTRQ